MTENIFIIASGTGGHVIPAKNISNILIKKKYNVTWIGTSTGIENRLVNNKKIMIKHINSSGVRGKNIINIIKGIFNMFTSFLHSLILIHKNKPLLVLGFGGYITVPVSIAAFVMRVPVYVHESNSIPGTANKINHFFSKITFQTFPGTFSKHKKIILSGNPISDSFSHITKPEIKYAKSKDKLNILIFGGSQGARFFNNTIPHCLSKFKSKFNIKHISGTGNREVVEKIYKKNDLVSEVIDFSNDMNSLYDWADIVISRAGSMTVSEISMSGRASILVPFTYATDNHQYYNAKYLERHKACIIIEENQYFSENIDKFLLNLYHEQKQLLSLSTNCKYLFPDDSGAIILGNISELDEKLNKTTSEE